MLIFTNSVPDPALARGAMEAAQKAIELAPDKPDGEMALGTYLRSVDRDYPRALEHYRKAEKLAPGAPDPLRSLGRAEMQMGRWQDAIAHYDEAERLDPRNAINVGNSSQPLLYLRRCGEARQAIDRTLALDPDNLNRIQQKLADPSVRRRRRRERAPSSRKCLVGSAPPRPPPKWSPRAWIGCSTPRASLSFAA